MASITSLSTRRLRELAQLRNDVTDAEQRLAHLRARLDKAIHDAHQEAGDRNMTAVATAAGVSRPTAYQAIRRHQATFKPKLPGI
ncbi:MAG TPA: hypothetical protein VG325_00535 [Solirubrobacteraceae bacterium]|jgi:DNA-binding phage protein|nr:hypothetical protein [Solirubrobacteraceae bacterium]